MFLNEMYDYRHKNSTRNLGQHETRAVHSVFCSNFPQELLQAKSNKSEKAKDNRCVHIVSNPKREYEKLV